MELSGLHDTAGLLRWGIEVGLTIDGGQHVLRRGHDHEDDCDKQARHPSAEYFYVLVRRYFSSPDDGKVLQEALIISRDSEALP